MYIYTHAYIYIYIYMHVHAFVVWSVCKDLLGVYVRSSSSSTMIFVCEDYRDYGGRTERGY